MFPHPHCNFCCPADGFGPQLVNHSGEVIDGGEVRLLNQAAYMIHSAVHAARPDVICAAHSHSIYGRTWCSLGRKIDSLTQDSCAFHNDHVVYDSFNGVVLAEKEGKDIAACLGNKKAALLQNHGLLTVGHTVEEVSLREHIEKEGGLTTKSDHILVRLIGEMLPQPAHGRGGRRIARRTSHQNRRGGSLVYLPYSWLTPGRVVQRKANV